MKLNNYKKYISLISAICLIGTSLFSNVIAFKNDAIDLDKNNQIIQNLGNQDQEYWALLVAVGEYADDPQQNRPLMLEEVDDLYDLMIDSQNWNEDHIKVIKGKEATVSNIIRGLRWLDRMEDSDDISLVYITTHGSPLDVDIPPFDEEDGFDEMLVSYWGFAYPMLFIYDDELNVLLNRLESKGVCLIVDSCFAGGFNDPPGWNIKNQNVAKKISSKQWIEGFGEDVRGQARIVLMASCEDEVSYSGGFAPYLIDGLRGYADSNMDNIVTAEEAFYYTEPRTFRQNPTIYDGYDGELPLIYLNESKYNFVEGNNNLKNNYDKTTKSHEVSIFSSETSIICGYVKDNETEDFIENAYVNVRGRDNDWDFFENETTTDSNGFYSINVPASRCSMTVYSIGYLSEQFGFLEIGENEIIWVNFSLSPHPQENSKICGYIIEQVSDIPISDANITLYWEDDQHQFYMNETISDENGFYLLNVAAGEVELDIEKKGYFREFLGSIEISEFEISWANFSLYPLPTESSIVCGYIKEEPSGNPINNARLTFEWVNISLGHEYQNETFTNSQGFFTINIAPGELYLDIRKQGYEFYDPYRHDCEEESINWLNISLKEETIEVDIAKPLNAIYLNNLRIRPFSKARIIGPIDIEAYVGQSWYGHGSAEMVEFYIDDELKTTLTEEPYVWKWDKKTFGKHTIKVIAYDNEGKSAIDEFEVFKLL